MVSSRLLLAVIMQNPIAVLCQQILRFALTEDSKTDLTHAGDNMERLSLHVLNSVKVLYFYCSFANKVLLACEFLGFTRVFCS